MTAPDPKWVDAVAKALIAMQPGNYVSQTIAQCYENAEVAVAALEPLIRKQIAAQIERYGDEALKECRAEYSAYLEGKADAYDTAERIARGTA